MAFQKQWFIMNARVKLYFSLGTKDSSNMQVDTRSWRLFFIVNDLHVSQILALWTRCTHRPCQTDEHKANRWTRKGYSELCCIF